MNDCDCPRLMFWSDWQVAAIKRSATYLKNQIQGYVKECHDQAETYTTGVLEEQNTIADILAEIGHAQRDKPAIAVIQESSEMFERITEAKRRKTDKYFVEEKRLQKKGKTYVLWLVKINNSS